MNPLLHLHRRHVMFLYRQALGCLGPVPAHPRITGTAMPSAGDSRHSERIA